MLGILSEMRRAGLHSRTHSRLAPKPSYDISQPRNLGLKKSHRAVIPSCWVNTLQTLWNSLTFPWQFPVFQTSHKWSTCSQGQWLLSLQIWNQSWVQVSPPGAFGLKSLSSSELLPLSRGSFWLRSRSLTKLPPYFSLSASCIHQVWGVQKPLVKGWAQTSQNRHCRWCS